MSSRNVEWSEFVTFMVNGKRINLLSSAWEYQDIREEYKPNSRIEWVTGWAVVDYDDLSAEVEVFQSRNEAMLDQFGEEDSRVMR